MYDNEEDPAGGAGDSVAGGDKGGAGAGGAAAPAAAPAGWNANEWVPKQRFQAVVAEKQTLSAKLTELQTEAQTLAERAATADTLAAQIAAANQRADEAAGRFQRFTEIAQVAKTTDPDVIELFDQQYGKLPAKDRPKRADWIEGLKVAIADEAKASTVPSVLAPFLAKITQAANPTGANGAGANGHAAARNPGGGGGGDGAQAVDAALMRKAAEKGRTTGDWSDYQALRAKTQWAPRAG